ncbi:hypothetical protein ACK356_20340 [Aeromonas veronii]|uniref:hypothetical protein n=1 Tax=Aeromonas TaxID=642 RepID=UPI0011A50647|nr:hypothetical protein [Aeromonas veronii]EKP0249900.1 hypothetical protein [Aeromonas veronii]MBA2076789.1 hypothetical protein [Aeromonas veronii]MCR3960980.1 hypothetical protein [Aeromonas veronii]MEB5668578.1 hypothetical protein [Aeromonas veronii]WFO52306.1 hypothetical protein L1O00_04610 [Aeromonas veronii]
MTQLILLIVALSTHGRSHEIAYEVCDEFIDDAVRYSEMDTMYLTTLRSQVMAAKDLAFFERLFSTTSDKLLRAYSAHSIEQAREMAFRDTRQWELLLLDIGIKMHGRPASELWSTYYLACRETLL